MAMAAAAILLACGIGAAWFALREPPEFQRAVSGRASAPAPGQPGQPGQGDLPSGHPSIDLPEEVTKFLDGLAATAAESPESVEAWTNLARARYRASVLNASYRRSAEQALQKLLELDPDNVEGLRIHANIAYDEGAFADAEKRFETYLEKAPADPTAITDLGSTLLFQDRTEEAVARYDEALAIDPEFLQAHFNRGIAMQRLGRVEEGLASLRRAAALAASDDQREHIENAIKEMETMARANGSAVAPPPAQEAPGANPSVAPAAPGNSTLSVTPGAPPSMPMPPPSPMREVPTNASGAFQREAEKTLIVHPILGRRIVSFEWTGDASGRVRVADFPMDQMPPFARAKFLSGMATDLAAQLAAAGTKGPASIEVVDDASGRVMETLTSEAGVAP
jgi:tetratricopeptide (TPR) repeat protein